MENAHDPLAGEVRRLRQRGRCGGWRGENAERFDGARAARGAEAAPAPKAGRTAKFEACMAGRG